MALLDFGRNIKFWVMNGETDRVAVYFLRDITAGDTIVLDQEFTIIKRGTLVGTTVAAALAASVSGTTVTIPAGASHDAAVLTVYGCANN